MGNFSEISEKYSETPVFFENMANILKQIGTFQNILMVSEYLSGAGSGMTFHATPIFFGAGRPDMTNMDDCRRKNVGVT